jgi:mono/diheme cytochrome c family protein
MIKRWFFIATAILLVALLTAACGGGASTPQGTPLPTLPAVPADYSGKQAPVDLSSSDLISQGKTVYTTNCATCHGEDGKGDGPAASGLTPPPVDFSSPYVKSMPPDFRFWRVSEGVPGTGMPAWKDILSADQIWQVIAYEMSFGK